MTDYNLYGSKGSVRIPGITDTPIETTVELLALAAYVFQVTGVLEAQTGAQDFDVGHVLAWDSTAKKYIAYNQGGSGDETTAVGFLRIGATTEANGDDAAVEVVVGGAVKYSIVSAASNWNAAVITDLGARYVESGDALIF